MNGVFSAFSAFSARGQGLWLMAPAALLITDRHLLARTRMQARARLAGQKNRKRMRSLLVDTYGSKLLRAAESGKGTSDRAGA